MVNLKRWHFILLIAVGLLTLYNIVPTVIYYSKPLKNEISQTQAEKIALQAVKRADRLEKESIKWLHSYAKLLKIDLTHVSLDEVNPQILHVKCKSEEQAKKLKTYLPKAGALIPFYPSQLSIMDEVDDLSPTEVLVQRKIGLCLSQPASFFQYGKVFDKNGLPTEEYKNLVHDRITQLLLSIGGTSENAFLMQAIQDNNSYAYRDQLLSTLSQNILSFTKIFGSDSSAARRFFASFTQGHFTNKTTTIDTLLEHLVSYKDKIKSEKVNLQALEAPSESESNKINLLKEKEDHLLQTIQLIKNNKNSFVAGNTPYSPSTVSGTKDLNRITTYDRNVIIKQIVLDWKNLSLTLSLHDDIVNELSHPANKEAVEKIVYNEIARIAKECDEVFSPINNEFTANLYELSDVKSFLTLDLAKIASRFSNQMHQTLLKYWNPYHEDLKRENFPLYAFDDFQSLPKEKQHLCLVFYTPKSYKESIDAGFKPGRVYVIAKDLGSITSKFSHANYDPQTESFKSDFDSLRKLLLRQGFIYYPGHSAQFSSEYTNDLIFEASDFYLPLIQAMRENFTIKGTKQFATLEFSDLKQRIHVTNEIETKEHEDLLKWKDEYHSCQVDPTMHSFYDVPSPVHNTIGNNLILSAKKYFRGDERKILHWGLDLSGGKTVLVELRDQNNKKVSSELDIRQGMNELYQRVNKMGVSEVSIRQEGNNITIDFPGAQSLSASELIKASSMHFHVVNEKFSSLNRNIVEHVNRFLQDVWNEAIVTNKKENQHVNLIAFHHLYGDKGDTLNPKPKSDSAKILYDNGHV